MFPVRAQGYPPAVTFVHVAAPPRNDGSQCCRRCGVELSAASDPQQWPVGGLVEIAVNGDGVVSTREVERRPDDELPLCLTALDDPPSHEVHVITE